jgi:Protein of unknown function (DUF2795)
VSSVVAQLQVLLEGVALPADRQALLHHASREGGAAADLALLEGLPDREYASIDEVGEMLRPVQPVSPPQQPEQPKPESGLPPGGEAYTDPAAVPGAVRD